VINCVRSMFAPDLVPGTAHCIACTVGRLRTTRRRAGATFATKRSGVDQAGQIDRIAGL
jgi:hypothetical protein